MLTGSLPQADEHQAEGERAPRTHARPGPRSGPGRGRRSGRAKSDVDDRAGEGAGDAVEVLHLGDHQLAELVDVAGLGAHDHVVRTGDVLGEGDALDLGDRARRPRRPCRRRSGSGCTPGRPWCISSCVGRGSRGLRAALNLPCSTSRPTGRPSRRGTRRPRSGGMGPCPFPADATARDVGEFGLIERAPRRCSRRASRCWSGPGDDAAVLRIRNGHVVVSTDLLVEGRHFRRDWATRRATSGTGPPPRTSPTSTRWAAARTR